MSRWTDPGAWRELVSESGCPICRAGRPSNLVVTLAASWVTAGEATPLRGACAVFARRHVVEPYELTAAEGALYFADLQRVGHAVQAITGAIKLNYEIHGNTIPHLHTHVFPRYPGDPFEGRPIDPQAAVAAVYAPGEFAVFCTRLQETLTEQARSGGLPLA